MKLSLNWINDFVNISDLTKDEVVSALMLSTAEVEEAENKGSDIKGVVVGQVLSIENIKGDINLVEVQYSSTDKTKVICGAPNVEKGMKVAFAPEGSSVIGLDVKRVKIYGHYSNGMCCSEKELGISEDHEGIIRLDEKLELGQDIKEIYEIDDTVLEIDNKSLTHRPDLWSHYGFAREISAIFSRTLKAPELFNQKNTGASTSLDIDISDKDDCYRYVGACVGNIDNKKSSSVNMRIRLFYTGMRSLNLLADISNYVMLELGQPMHVFDGKLVNGIEVKRPMKSSDFKSLDGELRKITPEDLLIYSSDNTPIAIAGIMGGLDTEVDSNTSSILIESATFNPSLIRRTSSKLGLRTEASQRYEKSLDPELAMTAFKRYLYILKKFDPSINLTSEITDNYAYKYPKIKIRTSEEYIKKYSGITSITKADILNTLKGLEFDVSTKGNVINVEVPTFRATKDISIEQDLLEEITRIYGYDNIKPEPIVDKVNPVEQSKDYTIERKAKSILVENFKLNEVHTYIWRNAQYNEKHDIVTPEGLKVLNSTVKGNDEIRTHLIPSLIQVAHKNIKAFQDQAIFEVARVANIDNYSDSKDNKVLAMLLMDKKGDYESLYFKMKEIIENLIYKLTGAEPEFNMDVDTGYQYLHPKNSAQILTDGKPIGGFGILSPKISLKMDKNAAIVVGELNLDTIKNIQPKPNIIKKISKYPSTHLDFNFLVPEDEEYRNVEKLIDNFCNEHALEVGFRLKDIFQENSMSSKSYTFEFEIYSHERTLKAGDIDGFSQDLIEYMLSNNIKLKK